MDLISTLRSLSQELTTAETNVKDTGRLAADAAVAIVDAQRRFGLAAKDMNPHAADVVKGLESGQLSISDALQRLHKDLDSLEGDLQQRRASTEKKLAGMLDIVRELSAMLARVHQEVSEEQQRTENALEDAARRSSEAHSESRAAMDDLNRFVRETYLPALVEHQRTTDSEKDALVKAVTEELIPAVEEQVKSLEAHMKTVEGELRARAAAISADIKAKAEGTVADTEGMVNAEMQTLQNETSVSAQALGAVVETMQVAMKAEHNAYAAAMERATTATKPQSEDLREIPVNLHKELKEARVI